MVSSIFARFFEHARSRVAPERRKSSKSMTLCSDRGSRKSAQPTRELDPVRAQNYRPSLRRSRSPLSIDPSPVAPTPSEVASSEAASRPAASKELRSVFDRCFDRCVEHLFRASSSSGASKRLEKRVLSSIFEPLGLRRGSNGEWSRAFSRASSRVLVPGWLQDAEKARKA